MTLDLSKSRTMFRRDDGTLSSDTADAKRIALGDLVALVSGGYSDTIAVGFFTATAKRESGYRYNEEDFDYNTDGSERAHTKGLYQISDKEAADVGMPNANLVDPMDATEVFRRLMERNLGADRTYLKPGEKSILDAATERGQAFDPKSPPADAWFYLALSHNMGLAAAVKSISQFGMDATAWKARNGNLARQVSYGGEIMQAALDGPPSSFHEALASLVTDDKGNADATKLVALGLASAGAIYLLWRHWT